MESKQLNNELGVNGGTPVRDSFLVYGAPDLDVREEQAITACLKSGWLSTGPRVKELEAKLSAYTGSMYTLGTNSCTAALHLSLLALNIGEGDEVITTPMTFGATCNVIEHVHAKPVLVDIEENSFLIDPQKIEAAITPRTKAIIPVHYAGYPCDMDRINDIARRHGLAVIEDAAHAIGTRYKNRPIGSGENLTCFSFYVTKNIAAGEGGAVTTNDSALLEQMSIGSLHGMSHGAWQRYTKSKQLHYEIIMPGFKYNMPDINAALALVQLDKLEDFLIRRQEIADRYFELLGSVPGLILPEQMRDAGDGVRCSWHLFPVMINPEMFTVTREDIMYAIIQENVGVATHYRAIFDQKYYREKYKLNRTEFPNASRVSDCVFSIPLSTNMNSADQDDVVEAINKVLNYYRK